MRGSSTVRRARTRAAASAAFGLMATVAVAGCGQAPEATRFVPAAVSPDRAASAPDQARPEVRKIEMH